MMVMALDSDISLSEEKLILRPDSDLEDMAALVVMDLVVCMEVMA